MNSNMKQIKKYNSNLLSKKISKCVKMALKNKLEKGSTIASRPPYGYKFKYIHENGNKIVTLEPAGDITTITVKKIYKLYLKGYGCGKIATYLNDKGIPVPSSYIENFKKSKFGLWSKNTIKAILTNEKYCGIMVQYKWKRVEGNKIMLTSQKERVYSGEFEGIVSKEDFDSVQALMKSKSRCCNSKERTLHLFSSLLICHECKGSMCYRKNYDGYKCNNSQTGKARCTAHSVKEEELKELVLHKIKKFCKKHEKDADFYSMLYGVVKDEGNLKDQLEHIDEKLKKVNYKLEKLKLESDKGKISEYAYGHKYHELKHKRKKLIKKREKLESLECNIEKWDNINNSYLNKAKKLLDTKEFSREILEELVEKIVVKENKEKKEKKVKVYLKVE
ncbi:recombinase family protein [Hathewaya histolytica]|uniref:recombinase family protein n=1 Tax=Hathewaya histolytica TaxID=1498 RepID=UPI003B6736C9